MRQITVGAAQFGPVPRDQSRAEVVERLLALLREGHRRGCDLVVFTEVALTAFFPHWYMKSQEEVDGYFEREMPGPDTGRMFEEAKRLGIGFCLGYEEIATEDGRTRRFNTSILVGPEGMIIGKYRKIHLQSSDRADPSRTWRSGTSR